MSSFARNFQIATVLKNTWTPNFVLTISQLQRDWDLQKSKRSFITIHWKFLRVFNMDKTEAAKKLDHSDGSALPEKSPSTKKSKLVKTAPQVSVRTVTTRSLTKIADKARFDQFLVGGQIHPLLIDHVVDKIIENIVWPSMPSAIPYPSLELKSKYLGNIRLVCKQWSDQGAKLYRKNRELEVAFGEERSDEGCWHPFDLKMEKYLNDMYYSRVIPVQRYFFEATFFTRENTSMFREFMLVFGPTIVDLELYFDNRSNMKFKRDSFANLKMPELRLLLIDLGGLFGYPSLFKRTHDILVEAILKAAVKLDKLYFRIPEKETTIDAELLGHQEKTFMRLREVILGNISNTVTCMYFDLPAIQ